ncbi:hypothetical protein [Salipaludibacillus aurantiacus]|uniref:Uncharacterized protein n=1 Tax=Salipaludibacillus aurantiacus TaxID=1601833 RepID=A0A1H9U0D5_9BACI|nr:hypothetical protein [Salipaludibacillus aurantiacus]SES02945.1 hypothetical protein SAMN05518684_106216 [Salipaludibacillus aurantiacus]
MSDFDVKEAAYVIPAPSSLHSDTVVYYVPVHEIDEKYPPKKKTPDEIQADRQALHNAKVSHRMHERMGLFW